MPVLLISRMLIYISLLLSIINIFFTFCLAIQTYQWKVLSLAWLWPLGFSSQLLNPYCFFAIARVCVLSSTWMISWSLLTPGMLARVLKLSCALFWFILDYIFLPSLNFLSHSNFLFLSLFGRHLRYLSPCYLIHLLRSSRWFMLCYIGNLLQSIGLGHFCTRSPFVPMTLWNFSGCATSFRATCWMFTTLPLISSIILSFCLSLPALHQLQRLSQLWQSPVPLQFPLPDVVISTISIPHHWTFYIQGFGVPISCCDT